MGRKHFLGAAGIIVSLMGVAGAASADEFGPAFRMDFGAEPRLLPELSAREVVAFNDERREYDFTAKGYFQIAGKTVARMPPLSGRADAQRERRTIKLSRSVRRTVRAAARRRGRDTVQLTIVYRLTQTQPEGDQAPLRQTAKQYVRLRIPRS